MRMQMSPPSALGGSEPVVYAPKSLGFPFRPHEEDAPPHLPLVHPSTSDPAPSWGGSDNHAASGMADAEPQPLETAHKKSGSKKDVFVCPEVHCGKQFPRSFALRRHMRIHTGTKPYACDFQGCSQRFNTSGNLSRHKRIHSGERPYPCVYETCGKRFNTSTKLKRHMRIHFPDGHNLFRCVEPQCSWACDNYKEYVQHQKLHLSVSEGFENATDENLSGNSKTLKVELKTTRVMPAPMGAVQQDAEPRAVEFPQQVADEYYQDRSRLFGVNNNTPAFVPAREDNDFRRLSGLPVKYDRVQPAPRLPFPTRAFPSENVGVPSSGLLGSSFHLSHLPSSSSHRYFDPNAPASTVEMTSSTSPSYSYAPTQTAAQQYSSYVSSFQPSSTSTSYLTTSEPYSQPLRQEDVDRHYESSSPHEMRQQPSQQTQTQYGSNPVPPEFTGEELSAVLELMKDS